MKKNIALLSSTYILTILLGLFFLAGCSKEYSAEGVGGPGGTVSGTWEFTEGNNYYSGLIDSVYIIKGAVINELHFEGVPSSGEESFHLVVYADSFKIGTYAASSFHSAFDYATPLTNIYTADQTVGEFIVKITSINKNVIIGTFSGTALKDGSSTVEITNGAFKAVLPEVIAGPPSEGVLGNMTGNCLPIQVNGVYQEGMPLNATNTVNVEVTVNKPGSYHIYTDPVNGIVFSATGIFTSRGTQAVTLTGSGTPAFDGYQEFIVHYDNSVCSFNIVFEESTIVSGDYFPTTDNTWWEYDREGAAFFVKVIPGNKAFDGKVYKVIGGFEHLNDTDFDTATILRKENGNYIDLSENKIFSEPTGDRIETIVLKDNVPKGTSWDGPNITDVINGTQITAHIKFTVTDRQVAASVGPFNFPDVIKIKGEIYGGNVPTGITMEHWYAKNVGLIYMKDIDGEEMRIQSYVVF